MSAATRSIVQDCKDYINQNNFTGLKKFYEELLNSEFAAPPDWIAIYQQVYLHACLRKRAEMVAWLRTLFDAMDPVAKIALRHVFPYGRALLAKG